MRKLVLLAVALLLPSLASAAGPSPRLIAKIRLAVGAGSIWIDGYGTAKVERVNPKTLRVVKRIRVGIAVWDVAYAFGSVWATNNAAGSVSRIDPATNRVVKTIKMGE